MLKCILEQQKLSEGKLSWFTGFHLTVGKTSVAFTSSVWKVLKKVIVELSIHRETFAIHQKSAKKP